MCLLVLSLESELDYEHTLSQMSDLIQNLWCKCTDGAAGQRKAQQ